MAEPLRSADSVTISDAIAMVTAARPARWDDEDAADAALRLVDDVLADFDPAAVRRLLGMVAFLGAVLEHRVQQDNDGADFLAGLGRLNAGTE